MILFENINQPFKLTGEIVGLGRMADHALEFSGESGRLVLRVDSAFVARRSRVARFGVWLLGRRGVLGWLCRWLYDDPAPGMPDGIIHYRGNSKLIEANGVWIIGGHASRAVFLVDRPSSTIFSLEGLSGEQFSDDPSTPA